MQGLPVVQAPGEGEAMCAALNEAGLVHACATCDGDVLLFGAQTTFHTLKLQVRLLFMAVALSCLFIRNRSDDS